jgi:spore coat protein U-like protein
LTGADETSFDRCDLRHSYGWFWPKRLVITDKKRGEFSTSHDAELDDNSTGASPLKARLLIGAITAAALMAAGPAPSFASTATGTLPVFVQVVNTCSVLKANMNFGQVNGQTVSQQADVTGFIFVECTNATAYDVGLDQGLYGDGTVTGRAMSDGSGDLINYSLFSDPAETQNWGDTVGTDTESGTGSGSLQKLIVFGQIPSQNLSVIGNYSDTVGVTITY